MQAIAHGAKPKSGKGPTGAQAREYVSGQSPRGLPETKKSAEDFVLLTPEEKKVNARQDRKLAPKKPAITPKKIPASTISMEWIQEQKKKLGFSKVEEETLDRLLKAFERRDDYTLVDPREYYGALQVMNEKVMGWVSEASKNLKDGEARDYALPVDGASLKVRKIANDMYSGWIIDKTGDIKHLFDRLTLPALASQIMSVYEVYDKDRPQDLRSIKDEIETINAQLKRHPKDISTLTERLYSLIETMSHIEGMATDLAAEQKRTMEVHAEHATNVGLDLHEIRNKLGELKTSIEAKAAPSPPPSAPEVPENMVTVRRTGTPGPCPDCSCERCNCYLHLTKPTIEIEPTGRITIMFKSDWNPLDKLNYLKSMKYVMAKADAPIKIKEHLKHSDDASGTVTFSDGAKIHYGQHPKGGKDYAIVEKPGRMKREFNPLAIKSPADGPHEYKYSVMDRTKSHRYMEDEEEAVHNKAAGR